MFNYSDSDEEYFVIRSNYQNLTLGVAEYLNHEGNRSTGFGLYENVNLKSDLDDKYLWKIEEVNFTLKVELYSVDFNQSLSDLVSMNKKQISIIDTAIINNNSPATLTHEVSSTKEMTETFSTSFGTSQSFMKSLTMGEEFGSSSTDSRLFQ